MKTLILICLSIALNAQICTVKDLPALLEKSKTDSVLKIERLAAMKFHKLINDYRKSKGVKELRWNDTLWLAARNHCIWMNSVNRLMHAEIKPHPFFTGEDPSDRLRYVMNFPEGDEYRGGLCGEIATRSISTEGDNIEKISLSIAKSAFLSWKSEPSHDYAMYDKGYTAHGIAFYRYCAADELY